LFLEGVPVGARRQRVDDEPRLDDGRQHEDPALHLEAAQLAHRRDAARAAQHDVHEHEIGTQLRDRANPVACRRALAHDLERWVSLHEQRAQSLSENRVIVDQENSQAVASTHRPARTSPGVVTTMSGRVRIRTLPLWDKHLPHQLPRAQT